MGLVISAHEPASRSLSGTQPDWPALERRSKFAAALLIVGAVVDSMSVAASFLQVQFLTRVRDDGDLFEGQIALSDLMIALIGLVQVSAYILTVVVFCRWMLHAYRCVLGIQPSWLTYTPREAVASFFIPFLNLVRPYWAMKELSVASAEPGEAPVAIVGIWWAFYLVMGFLGNISARAVWRAEEIPQVIVATWLSIAADAVSVPAAILAAFLVRRVSSGLPKTLATAEATIGTHATGSVQPV